MKFGICNDSNILNWQVKLVFAVFGWKFPFWATFSEKIKIKNSLFNMKSDN